MLLYDVKMLRKPLETRCSTAFSGEISSEIDRYLPTSAGSLLPLFLDWWNYFSFSKWRDAFE